MQHRLRQAALVLCACVIAIPSAEARSRSLFDGFTRAFQPKAVTHRKAKTAQIRHRWRVVTHPTKVSPARFRQAAKPVPPPVGHPDLDRYDANWGKGSGNVVLPDTQALRDLAEMYAKQNGIDPRLGVALIQVESRFDPWATGSAGEIGLGQLKLQTAVDLGYTGNARGLYHVGTNLRYSMRYLAMAKAKSDGSQCGALSKYNAGLYSSERRSDYCRRITAAMN